jgi:guanine nucleotide-binding protein alpha-1 subunit
MAPFARLSYEDRDPLAAVTAPPPNESAEERNARIAAEHAATQRSKAIDEEINKQRNADKKAPKAVKVLLLGECRRLSIYPTP